MFEPKRTSKENLANYIGARVTDAEVEWLRAEMLRRKLTMSDLIARSQEIGGGSKTGAVS